ncbi:MAG: formylglycine-generating enzyme family protein [Anaerolineaceae bacterium]|nr:formylglycine-generating enzyme family protein [Anaerolineaceae bacterium]
MTKKRIGIYLILPILFLSAGWVLFNKYIRPNHYQLLYPYSIFQFRDLSPAETRVGEDERLEIRIVSGEEADPFWIDQIPVTAAAYKRFLSQSGLLAPRYRNEYRIYWDSRLYDLLPVVFVSWGQAEDYCEYYGGHLPTEAQWEMAARGPEGIVLYWDDNTKAFNKANYDNFYKGKTFAGWLPQGQTVFGVMEMSGNVREWVLDWLITPGQELNTGPWQMIRDQEQGGYGRILKGGSYVDDVSHLRLNSRDEHDPNSPGINRGFRCVYEE